jgi:5-hydroxyisourate hydrolase
LSNDPEKQMSGISTHVLDTASGRPAGGVPVTLEVARGADWLVLGSGTTDGNGRLSTLLTLPPEPGTYRITFNSGAYFPTGFFPSVMITFRVEAGQDHYHVPLLLSPFGYSTYRGS